MRELNFDEIHSIFGGSGDLVAESRAEPQAGESLAAAPLPWDLAGFAALPAEPSWR
jgi:hypothetical protein